MMEPEKLDPERVQAERAYVQWGLDDGYNHTSGVMNLSDAVVLYTLLTCVDKIPYAKVHRVEVRAWPISFDATSI